jgi:hypothetical protein
MVPASLGSFVQRVFIQKTIDTMSGEPVTRTSVNRIRVILQRLEEEIGLGWLRLRERLVAKELVSRCESVAALTTHAEHAAIIEAFANC